MDLVGKQKSQHGSKPKSVLLCTKWLLKAHYLASGTSALTIRGTNAVATSIASTAARGRGLACLPCADGLRLEPSSLWWCSCP